MDSNKTGTTITEQSKTKIEEEVKETTEAEVVIPINVEVITTRIRTWINNIILIKWKATNNNLKEWIQICLNQFQQEDQLIHNSSKICNNSQEAKIKCAKWSNCHQLTPLLSKPLKVHKFKNSLETASMVTFNKHLVMNLLQELQECF